ncbi:hypothetical protein DUI87_22182 [Hirundo rustica rustica]|uniref:Uncharacterized protein n=1 Tax=Hirundo rustica rustica TaxID=333673 RepID=A0A3M0JJX0_HIRRU|nr:hypothetical protein DUI87_22182 [Hirundo rustica rustica]
MLRYSTTSLSFTKKCSSYSAQVQQMKGRAEKLTSVGGDEAGDHPRNLKVTKAVEHDKMPPWIIRELSGDVVKPLFIIFEKPWQSGGGFTYCKRGNITLIFNRQIKGHPQNYRVGSACGKIEQILLEIMPRHMENKEIISDIFMWLH